VVPVDPGTELIAEIRGYPASPPVPGFQRLELGGFPYAERESAASTWYTSITLQT
jgi:hypothetical protein